MLTSAPQKHTTAVLMLCVTIPRDRTTVYVNLDTMEMAITATQVIFISLNIFLHFNDYALAL